MADIIIQVRDYQGIEVAKMRVRKGLTAIIGKTNAGKSSIMRAVEDLLENSCGDSDVRIGAEQASIAMKNNDNVVKLIRNPNKPIKTQYIINGEEIEKVGRNKVEETDILGIVPTGEYNLNFIKQEDLPFLIYENGYRLYEFISQSKSKVLLDAVEKLTKSKKEIEKDIKVTDAEINEIKNRYQEIAEELKQYPKISEIYNLNKTVDEYSEEIEKAEDRKLDYERDRKLEIEIDNSIISINKLLSNLEKLNLGKIENIVRENEKLRELKNTYEQTEKMYYNNENKIKEIEKTIFKFNSNEIIDTINFISSSLALKNVYDRNGKELCIVESTLQKYPSIEFNVDVSIINLLDNARELESEYNKYNKQIEHIDNSLENINCDIEKHEKFLSENKICPTCGQLIKDCKESE